ncbi:phosphotransferase [Mycoplasmatota bacterium WC44]
MEKLLEHLGLEGYEVIEDEIGRSESSIYLIKQDDYDTYLKVGNEDVKKLTKVLEFLKDKDINVPTLIKSGLYNGQYYVLMSKCEGTMTYELEPELAVKVLATGLKRLHSIDISRCNIKYYDNELMTRVKENIMNNVSIDEQVKLLGILDLKMEEDLVFTHGDYCLPNILFENDDISFIDLDRAGISDRYLDIVDCIWSIKYNFKSDIYVDLFLKEYGIEELNESKLQFFNIIRENC